MTDTHSATRRAAIWWRAFRYHFVPPSFLPAILGSVVAWAVTGRFSQLYFAVVVIAVTLNHIALNITDDYYDYKHSVDQAGAHDTNPYSGGSGLLTAGTITPRRMRGLFLALYLATCLAGAFLTVARGWPVLAFGLVGVLSAYFYTAPPIRYAYRGLGELSQLVNFSLIIGLGSYYVQAQGLRWEAALAVLPLGLMMFAMITINEIPDADTDRSGGKRTLVVRFGRRVGVRLYGAAGTAAYLVILLTPIFGLTTYWTYLAMLTFPLFARAFLILRKNYDKPAAMSPANLLTIRAHNIMGIALILAYVVHGFLIQRQVTDMIVPLLMLVVLYLPVALTIFSRPKEVEKPVAA